MVTARSMAMCVVHVRHVRMLMMQPFVAMPMGVRFAGWVARAVGVPMMLVVHVGMRMFHGHMLVLVVVILREVQPDT